MNDKLADLLRETGQQTVSIKLSLKDIHRYMSFEKKPELIALWAQIYVDLYEKSQVR